MGAASAQYDGQWTAAERTLLETKVAANRTKHRAVKKGRGLFMDAIVQKLSFG